MLSQKHYIEKILKKFRHFDSKPVCTPYDANNELKNNRGDSISQSEYAKIIDSLIHLMFCTCPDIAYTICILSRYTHSPMEN